MKQNVFWTKHCPRLTVAGEATSKSIGSKIKFVVGASWMISPDIRQSFLLSSKTVFMFSIQTASTGPSNINHFLEHRQISYYKCSFLISLIWNMSLQKKQVDSSNIVFKIDNGNPYSIAKRLKFNKPQISILKTFGDETTQIGII